MPRFCRRIGAVGGPHQHICVLTTITSLPPASKTLRRWTCWLSEQVATSYWYAITEGASWGSGRGLSVSWS